MRQAAYIVSMIALVATVAPAFVYFAGRITMEQMKMAMDVAMIVWFVATPLWMGKAPQAPTAAEPAVGSH
jgi:hypothetical protein